MVTTDHPDSAPKSGQKLLIGRVDKKGDIFLSHDAEGFPNHPQMIWEHVPVFDRNFKVYKRNSIADIWELYNEGSESFTDHKPKSPMIPIILFHEN